jgi:hypothetical protein
VAGVDNGRMSDRRDREHRFERLRRGDDRSRGPHQQTLAGRAVDTRPSARRDTPGKGTLSETLDTSPTEPAHEVAFQLSRARVQLAALAAANDVKNAEQSVLAASEIELCLHYAQRAVAHAWLISHVETDAMRTSVAELEHDAQPVLAAAFKPSRSPRRAWGDRTTYEIEASTWSGRSTIRTAAARSTEV